MAAGRVATAVPSHRHRRREEDKLLGLNRYTADNLLRAILYRSTARGEARIRWPVAADSRRDGAIVAKDNGNNRDATGKVSGHDTKTDALTSR